MRNLSTILGAWAVLAVSSIASADGDAVLYQLTKASTFERGCFPPCMCPAGPQLPIDGTFLLTQQGGPLSFDQYSITDLRWTVKTGETTLQFTGGGHYQRRSMGDPAHRLELDLKDDAGDVEHYDSGDDYIAGGAEFPVIDIIISVNGGFCFDTVVHMVAEPVRPAAVYRLRRGSEWSRGCFGDCDCALRGPFPMTGTFTMAFKEGNPLFTTYSVENIDWMVKDDYVPHSIKGSGTYTVGGEVAVIQRLELDLETDGEPPEHFDSGYVSGGVQFPAIDVEINVNGLVCFDTLIHVRAKPVGDFNLDAVVDKIDLERFLACFTGPARPMQDPTCDAVDLDDDKDVDQGDFGLLQRCMTGPALPVDPACAD